MSFKENLLTKIKIDRLAAKVIASIGPAESGRKLDKEAMRSLLEMGPYEHQKVRDLDLYIEDTDQEPKIIFVLDNELPIYRTTTDDVAMRKSPLISEMVKIRNIIKILKDSDVKLSRKEESVKAIQKECIDRLDLSYNEADIEEIARDGAASLENKYVDGVTESLSLFAELLEYRPPPEALRIRHHEIFGAMIEKEAGEVLYGPIVIFSPMDNNLMLIEERISSFDRPKLDYIRQVVTGNEKAAIEGADVFRYLKQAVANKSR